MGAPKATHCRHCGEGGELYRGAHVACKNEHNRKRAAEERGPNHCRRCWVVIEAGIELCADCATAARKEALRRYEEKRKRQKACACACGGELPRGFTGRFLPDHNPRLRQPKKPKRRRKAAQKKQHPMGNITISKPKPLTGEPTNPRGIEPRRIPPVGAAGWSVSEARRWW